MKGKDRMGNQIYKEISKFAEMQRDEIKREKAKEKRKQTRYEIKKHIAKETYKPALFEEGEDHV